MSTTNMKNWLVGMILLAAPQVNAADFIWSGGSSSAPPYLWSDGDNWGGTAPGATGQTLIFSGTTGLANSNGHVTRVNGFRFLEDAGAFVLSGNQVELNGDIISRSAFDQTFGMAIQLYGNARIVDTGKGTIKFNGGLSNEATRRLTKVGIGTLEVRGNSSEHAGETRIYEGHVLVDAAVGNQVFTDSQIYLGETVGSTGYDGYVGYNASNNPILEITGGDAVFSKNLALYGNSRMTVKAGTGVDVLFSGLSANGNRGLHFDLTASGSSMGFKTSAAVAALASATVTEIVGGNLQTGFAKLVLDPGADPESIADDRYNVVRLSAGDYINVSSSTNDTHNTSVSGNYTIVGVGDKNTSTLTIQGSGVMDGGGMFRSRAILLEEGVGDYTFDVAVGAIVTGSVALKVFQHSLNGVLTFNNRLMLEEGPASADLVFGGPGTTRISESSVSTFIAPTRIQQGHLIMDGELTRTAFVMVYDDATLSGSGSIGETVATAVHIRSGGTLAASTLGALELNATMRFQDESRFSMTLDAAGSDFVEVSGAITLDDNVNLTLSLAGPQLVAQSYRLLQGESITGTFATINNEAFGPEGLFTLSYNNVDYEFKLVKLVNGGNEELWAQAMAIPEPSTYALLAGVGVAGMLLRRRFRLV